jgi:hypothetical protein
LNTRYPFRQLSIACCERPRSLSYDRLPPFGGRVRPQSHDGEERRLLLDFSVVDLEVSECGILVCVDEVVDFAIATKCQLPVYTAVSIECWKVNWEIPNAALQLEPRAQ